MQDVLATIYSQEVQQIKVPHCHEQSQCPALSFLRIYCVTERTVGCLAATTQICTIETSQIMKQRSMRRTDEILWT